VNRVDEVVAVRMLASGSLDRSFGTHGYTLVPIGKSAGANAVALQSNGDIVLAGSGRDPNTGTLSLAAVRLTPNGALDPSFGHGGVVTVPVGSEAIANAVVIQPNGAIVLAGTAYTDHDRFVAARLTPSGAVDSSFGSGGVELLAPTAAGWGMVLQQNGDVVIGGEEQISGTWAFMAARLTTSGAPDPTFGNGGIVTISIGQKAVGLAIALQPDGRIVMTGNANTGTAVIGTVRLNANGTLDSTFGSGGISTFAGDLSQAVAIEPNGDIVLGGAGASAVRLLPNGTIDQSFGKRGMAIVPLGTNDAANGVTYDAVDGNLLLTGVATVNGAVVMTVIQLTG
jgi:uncharacterized delta-60 repeat protein